MKNFKKVLLGMALGLSITSAPIHASGFDAEGLTEIFEAAGEAIEIASDFVEPVISGAVGAIKKVGSGVINVGKSLWNKIF